MTKPTRILHSENDNSEYWIVAILPDNSEGLITRYVQPDGVAGRRYMYPSKEKAKAAEKLFHKKNASEESKKPFPKTYPEEKADRFCEDCNNWATCTKKLIQAATTCTQYVPILSAKRKIDLKTKESNPKYSEGVKKAPLHCIPSGPIYELGLAMFEGSRKYGRHNYRAIGVRASTYYDAAMGHIKDWWEGEDIDPDSGLHHLIKAAACLLVVRDSMLMGNFSDDRPLRYPEKHGRSDFNEQVKEIVKKYPDCVEPYLESNKDKRSEKTPGFISAEELTKELGLKGCGLEESDFDK